MLNSRFRDVVLNTGISSLTDSPPNYILNQVSFNIFQGILLKKVLIFILKLIKLRMKNNIEGDK